MNTRPRLGGEEKGLRHLDNHLSKVLATKEILKRLFGFGKLKGPVDDGVDLRPGVDAEHLLKAVLGPVEDALERDVALERQQVGVHAVSRRVLLTRQVADAAYEPAKGHALKGLGQRLGAARLEDHVGAPAARELQHRLLPLGRRLVVDDVVRAHALCALQLGVRRRRHNGRQAQRFRDLQARDGDAARALEQDDLVAARQWLAQRLEPVDGHPGRDGRDGQGRGLVVRHVVGHRHEAVVGKHAVLGEAARVREAEAGPHVLLLDLAPDVRLVERRHDSLSLPERGHAAADLYDGTADIRARHQRTGSLLHGVVVPVQAHDN